MLSFTHKHWKLPWISFCILHFVWWPRILRVTGWMRLWKPGFRLRFLAFLNFLNFLNFLIWARKKDILKKQHILYPQSRIARPEESMPTFGTRTPGDVPYLGNPAFLAHGYNCLWFYVPGMCHWFHLVFFFLAGLYQIYLAPISWPLWSPLGYICAVDYGNVILGYFSFLWWTANSLDIYIVFLVISAVYWSCLVFFLLFLFVVFERCFLDYSLHQFWISWKRPADFRAHQPGPSIIHSDAVHELHVDTSIYGVINCDF